MLKAAAISAPRTWLLPRLGPRLGSNLKRRTLAVSRIFNASRSSSRCHHDSVNARSRWGRRARLLHRLWPGFSPARSTLPAAQDGWRSPTRFRPANGPPRAQSSDWRPAARDRRSRRRRNWCQAEQNDVQGDRVDRHPTRDLPGQTAHARNYHRSAFDYHSR